MSKSDSLESENKQIGLLRALESVKSKSKQMNKMSPKIKVERSQ